MSIKFSTGSDKMVDLGKSLFLISPYERRSLKMHDSVVT